MADAVVLGCVSPEQALGNSTEIRTSCWPPLLILAPHTSPPIDSCALPVPSEADTPPTCSENHNLNASGGFRIKIKVRLEVAGLQMLGQPNREATGGQEQFCHKAGAWQAPPPRCRRRPGEGAGEGAKMGQIGPGKPVASRNRPRHRGARQSGQTTSMQPISNKNRQHPRTRRERIRWT